MEKLDLSVIIAAYEAQNFLEDCINSIINQNFKVEILLGIDGCASTLEFAQNNDLIKNNCRLFYFDNNFGTYIVLNSLLNCCSFNNTIIFDADDIMLDGILKETNQKLHTYDVVRWEFFNFYNFDTKKLIESKQFAIGACGIKKDILLNFNGFYPWRFSADYEFQLRSENEGISTYYSNNKFLRRLHEKNMTKRKDTGLDSEARKSLHIKIEEMIANKNFKNPDKLYVENFKEILGEKND